MGYSVSSLTRLRIAPADPEQNTRSELTALRARGTGVDSGPIYVRLQEPLTE